MTLPQGRRHVAHLLLKGAQDVMMRAILQAYAVCVRALLALVWQRDHDNGHDRAGAEGKDLDAPCRVPLIDKRDTTSQT
jgi:hypothetical protein